MEILFQKLNSLVSSPQNSSTQIPDILLLFYDQIMRNSDQISKISSTVHQSKQQTLTQMGGKISLSDFPSLLEKYNPKIYSEIDALKERIISLQVKLLSYNQFANSNFMQSKNSHLKQYQMRSLEDMIMANQQYIKGTINQLLITKVDRVELQRLYSLNDRFDAELTNISKGLIEMARTPYPISDSRQKKNNQKLEKMQNLQQKVQKMQKIDKDILSKQHQLIKLFKQQEQKLISFQTRLPEIQLTLTKFIQTQKQTLHSDLFEFVSKSLDYRAQQFQQLIQEKILTSLHNSKTSQSQSINTLKQEFVELFQQVNRLKRNQGKGWNKQEMIQIIDKHLLELEDQLTSQRSPNTDRDLISQQVLRLARKLEIEIKERKQFSARDIISLKRQIESRATLRDVQKIISKFSTFQETKQLVCSEIKKVEEGETFLNIRQFIDDQIIINEALCSENIIGRWFWEGQQLKGGNLIPWQKQIINTSPETYLWEQNTYQLIILTEGIYRVQLGVYSEEKKKPTIQLIINGNAVLSAINNSSYVIHHSSGRLKENNGGKVSGVSGITLIDFLAIPSKARIAVSNVGSGNRGFLSLKKM